MLVSYNLVDVLPKWILQINSTTFTIWAVFIAIKWAFHLAPRRFRIPHIIARFIKIKAVACESQAVIAADGQK